MNQAIHERVNTIPRDGEWWKSDSRDIFIVNCEKLLGKGFSLDEAIAILSELYFAVVEEFGE